MSNEMIFDHKTKPDQYDDLAPDGSEIRLLTRIQRGSCAHCILPAGKTSLAVQHKTVEEIWYVLSGKGEMWQRSSRGQATVELSEGVGLTIPTGNHFQFRNTGAEPLCILLVTMPPWPDIEEALFVDGHWK
jgi:mannose-6-phosphate isomerase-like protein (cupin superfamily)